MTTQGSRQYRTLGLLWAAYGVVMAAVGVWIIVYNRTLSMMWGAIITRVPNPFAWMTGFQFFLGATVVMAFATSVVSLLASAALMRGADSSGTWGLTAAAFGLLGIPPGVALGAFPVAILLPGRKADKIA